MLKNINIGMRLSMGFLIILFFLIIVFFYIINQMGALSNLTSLMYKHPLTVSNAVLRIDYNIIRIHRSMKDIVLAKNEDEISYAVNQVNQIESLVYKDFDIVADRFLGDSSMYLNARDLFSKWKPIRESVIELIYQGESLEAAEITKGKGARHVEKLENAMQALNEFAQNKANTFYHEAQERRAKTLKITYILTTIVFFVGTGLIILLTWSITRPLSTMMNAVKEISSGNLERRIYIQSRDEIGQLATAFNQMTAKLQASYKFLEEKIHTRTIELEKTNTDLKHKIVEHELAEENLLLHTQALDNMLEGVNILKTLNGKFIYMNTAFEQMFGYNKNELADQHISKIIAPLPEKSSIDVADEIISQLLLNGEWEGTLANVKKDGTHFWTQTKISVFEHSIHGKIGISVQEDITERKKAEEQIKSALKEKETLLRELYHRTKNNMQVIRSIISLQRAYSKNEELELIFQETENKIQAMALVHQKLYQSKDLSKINLAEYFKELIDLIMKSYQTPPGQISLNLDMQDVIVLIDTAIPCGLIVNELLSNTLKHAFPDNVKGDISINLSRNKKGCIEIHFTDNGIGVPQNFDFRTQKTLGLQTITTIAEHQLKGEINFNSDNGISCHITFTDENNNPRV